MKASINAKASSGFELVRSVANYTMRCGQKEYLLPVERHHAAVGVDDLDTIVNFRVVGCGDHETDRLRNNASVEKAHLLVVHTPKNSDDSDADKNRRQHVVVHSESGSAVNELGVGLGNAFQMVVNCGV